MTNKESSLTYDPASGLSFTWTARNQLANAGIPSEVYDGLGRREEATGFDIQYFLHDGGSVLGWWDSSGNSWDFLNLPGGGALAGSNTIGGTMTTWVPLIDASGSTIALVNAASTGSSPTTTYTYDPSGNPTENPTGNTWPFLYQGLEKEPSDPAPLYYSGGGQFYNPQLVRSLSEQGQTSSNGSGGGPSGRAISPPSGSSGGLSPQSVYNDTQQALQVGTDIYLGAGLLAYFLGPEAPPFVAPLALIGGAIDFLVNFFEDIFGGSSSETPRQLLSRRHPLYPKIIGVSEDLIPDEAPSGKPEFCGDPQPCRKRPLGKDNSQPEYRKAPPSAQPQTGLGLFFACGGVFTAFNPELTGGCVITGVGCAGGAIPACVEAAVLCGSYFGGIGLCYGAAFPNSWLGPGARGPVPNQGQ